MVWVQHLGYLGDRRGGLGHWNLGHQQKKQKYIEIERDIYYFQPPGIKILTQTRKFAQTHLSQNGLKEEIDVNADVPSDDGPTVARRPVMPVDALGVEMAVDGRQLMEGQLLGLWA